jgi:hypothetical protein
MESHDERIATSMEEPAMEDPQTPTLVRDPSVPQPYGTVCHG